MQSGPYSAWIERRKDGWWCVEAFVGFGREYGPYRWAWQAWFKKWEVAP
jgi:hypothetical protein